MSVDALSRFEAISSLYYHRFGRLAPGKYEAPETGRDSNDEENREQFGKWLVSGPAFDDAIARIVEMQEVLERWNRLDIDVAEIADLSRKTERLLR